MSYYNKTSVLRRIGNKSKLIRKIIPHIPLDFDCLISFFYGSGSLENCFVGRIKSLIANDYDADVYNVYQVLMTQYERLRRVLEATPYHQLVFDDSKRQLPDDPVMRAAGFLILQNWSYLGKGDTMFFCTQENNKRITLKKLTANYELLVNNPITTVQFVSCDFREVLGSIQLKGKHCSTFGYFDPPYVGTGNNYNTPKWKLKDTQDCMDIMATCGFRCAMSEFDNHEVIAEAERRGLNVVSLGERQSLKNRNIEILITNYAERQFRMF